MSPRAMVDLFKLPEDERIRYIVGLILDGGRVGLLLEDEKLAPGKIQRYIEKVKAKMPGVTVKVSDGPVPNVSTVTFVMGGVDGDARLQISES